MKKSVFKTLHKIPTDNLQISKKLGTVQTVHYKKDQKNRSIRSKSESNEHSFNTISSRNRHRTKQSPILDLKKIHSAKPYSNPKRMFLSPKWQSSKIDLKGSLVGLKKKKSNIQIIPDTKKGTVYLHGNMNTGIKN